jgi:hypothetical protein
VAHHDSLINQPLEDLFADMIELAGLIDLGAADWIKYNSDVPDLLAGVRL